jgi:hypothetical protein
MLSGLPVRSVYPAPTAVFLELQAPLLLLAILGGYVVPPLALLARERHMWALVAYFCHFVLVLTS